MKLKNRADADGSRNDDLIKIYVFLPIRFDYAWWGNHVNKVAAMVGGSFRQF